MKVVALEPFSGSGIRRLGIVATLAACIALPAAAGSKPGGRVGSVVVIASDSSSGKMIKGVEVRIHEPGYFLSDSHWEPEWVAFTDSNGCATMEGIPSGPYEVHLCNQVFERKALEITIAPGPPDTVRVPLTYVGPPRDGRRCEVYFYSQGIDSGGGVVVIATEAETGAPVAFGKVVILGARSFARSELARGAMTDEHGRARLSLEPGPNRLQVDARGRLGKIESITIVAGKVDTLRVRLDPDSVRLESGRRR
jgi:hypothetical protein